MRLRHLLLIAAVLFCPAISHAVTCSVSNVQPINLGSVNPLSATGATSSMTFNYTCTKELGDALAGINLCFNIGASAVSGQVTPRNMSLSGTPARTLAYQLYQDAGHTKVWGSQYQSGTTFPMVQLNLLNLTPVTGSLTVSAQIVTPQTSAVPGSYQDSYTAATALVTSILDCFSRRPPVAIPLPPGFPSPYRRRSANSAISPLQPILALRQPGRPGVT